MFTAEPSFSDDGAEVDSLIKTSMNDVLGIARKPGMNNEDKRTELWKIVQKTFDFAKITEFTLGQFSYNSTSVLGEYSDRRFTKAEQEEFREVFTRHLGNTYLDRMDFKNVDVIIDLKPAEILEAKKGIKRAQVKTMINKKTPIDYILLNEGKDWKIYDVKVEGRSLVSAFRTEYKAILLKNKPKVLTQMLKDKIKEHESSKTKKKS
ncbi:MAG: ABC transporter substrate-binding protein [Desulfobacteraceae bacterium]|jgi:phospholipid transport system substrate-binding protein